MTGIARLFLVARPGPLADGLLGLLTAVSATRAVDRVDRLPDLTEVVRKSDPAVVLITLGSSTKNEIEDLVRFKAASPSSKCVVLANDVRQQRAVEELGAEAVLLKGCQPADLVAAIQTLTGS